MKAAIICLFFISAALCTESEVPQLDIARGSSYHGLVSEDATQVEVTPKIRATGRPICSFKITKKHHGEAPFELVLVDQETGEAELRARRPLNCEKRKTYSFDFVAVACSGTTSENATVHVTVSDVNEYAPKFGAPAYVAEVDEGRVYDRVIQVEAEDADCSEKYGDICKYAILNEDEPFAIDDEGVIRTTAPLSHEKSHNHILKVVAYDCGMKVSDPVLITVKVNRVCKLGWQDVPERISYIPGSGRRLLFPDTKFDLCNVPCTPKKIQSRISLATSHLGRRCDRDTYSVRDQRKICGASDDSIDLLPFPGPGTEWTASLPTDEGHEADPVYAFDGLSTGTVIPSHILPHNFTHTFSLSVWLRHAIGVVADKKLKEHVFCIADDHHMNRHHISVFVRNCRLILLVRREFGDGDLNSFKPAEWRWKLPQVCDDEWHHYSVNVQMPDVELYVDGILFRSDEKNPEIIDDWPLHPAPGLNTTISVGACWQGSEQRLKHHMKGYMAGLSVLIGKTEKSEVLSCLRRCQEGLELPPLEFLQPGMQILNNNDMTEITVNGENRTEIESIVRQIAYKNSRDFPVPGRRGLRLYTSMVCESGKTIKLPPVDSEVIVQPAAEPVIGISGVSNLSLDYSSFEHGVRLFPDVQIIVTSEDADDDDDSSEDESDEDETDDEIVSSSAKIDSCLVTVNPPLNPDHEVIALPSGLLQQLGLTSRVAAEGFTLKGTDKAFHYEQVLRQVIYSNRRPAYYLTRVFKLVCSELNGRFVSNELGLTLNVLHPAPSTSPPIRASTEKISVAKISSHRLPPVQSHLEVARHHVDAPQPFSDLYFSPGGNSGHFPAGMAQGAGHAVTIIVIVCASFLVLMITLGIVRVRAAQRRAREETNAESEMAWDDMALNITVNPLDALDSKDKATMTVIAQIPEVADDSSSDSNDSDDYDFDDDDDEDFRVDHLPQSKDLEWDQSL